MKKKKGLKITLISLAAFFAVLLIVFSCYVNVYYHAVNVDGTFNNENTDLVIERENDYFAFVPKEATKGLIFYPGAKVEYTAYAPLLRSLADNGILTVGLKMPFNLAFFGQNEADKILEKYSVDLWYLSGHSLGGAMAGAYMSKHSEDYKGLIFLASYSTKDLSKTNLDVLSIYGSEDKVLNTGNLEKYNSNLPNNTIRKVIEGGCHAYFGSYGYQKGDGTPTISQEEQVQITTSYIVDFIGE